MSDDLRKTIETLWDERDGVSPATAGSPRVAVEQALSLLESGQARVAEKTNAGWEVNQWLKKAVLLSFRLNDNEIMAGPGAANWFDKVPSKFEGWG